MFARFSIDLPANISIVAIPPKSRLAPIHPGQVNQFVDASRDPRAYDQRAFFAHNDR
jgi:hypothetical protein